VLEELRIVIEPELREAGISIRWDLPESVPPAWAERQALLQAFLNLVKNSQRAMEGQHNGELIVRLSSEEDGVFVRFIDKGHGVAKPEHLFKPFQQGAAATGLGLYLSRAFVRAFRGDIRYEPRPSGCCFAVVLTPAAERDEEMRSGMRRCGQAMTARTRLLLLDDHILFRESLSQLLDTEPDFQVVAHCTTCEEALEALSHEVVDLVLLDYDLGEETGLQFIRRAREAGYKCRVFIVTAGMTDSDDT